MDITLITYSAHYLCSVLLSFSTYIKTLGDQYSRSFSSHLVPRICQPSIIDTSVYLSILSTPKVMVMAPSILQLQTQAGTQPMAIGRASKSHSDDSISILSSSCSSASPKVSLDIVRCSRCQRSLSIDLSSGVLIWLALSNELSSALKRSASDAKNESTGTQHIRPNSRMYQIANKSYLRTNHTIPALCLSTARLRLACVNGRCLRGG